MSTHFPGKQDLDYFVLNTKQPTFEGFISLKQSSLAKWSNNTSISSPMLYFGLWKRRFLFSMTYLRPDLNLKNPKFDAEHWQALYNEVVALRTASQIYRTESLRTLGAAGPSAAQTLIEMIDDDNSAATINSTGPVCPTTSVDSPTSVTTDVDLEPGFMDIHSIFSKRAQGRQLSSKDIYNLNSVIQSGGSDVKDKLASFACKMLLKQEWDTTDDILAKLSVSSICNLISPTTFGVLKDILSDEELLRLENLPVPTYPGLSLEDTQYIECLLQSSSSVDDVLEQVYTKQKELVSRSKRASELYAALSIIHSVAENLDSWKARDSEVTVYRRLASLLDILLRRSSVDLVDGECCSMSSKDAMILGQANDSEMATPYGRKIDLMIVTSAHNLRVELNSSEWKTQQATGAAILKQQSKNMRTNAAILSKLEKLANCNHIMAMDWVGTTGYLYILMNDKGIFVAKLVACLSIPTSFGQLKGFLKTLDSLFSWKKHIDTLAINVCQAIDEKKLPLAGIVRKSTSASFEREASPAATPVFSPKQKKRLFVQVEE